MSTSVKQATNSKLLTGKRGWWWSPNAKKAHFFLERDNGRALCNGLLVFATSILFHELSDKWHASPDNCAACKKKRAAMVKRGELPAEEGGEEQ